MALRERGFSISQELISTGTYLWHAEKHDLHFIAEGPIELLSIVGVDETRGGIWKASDEEIDAFLTEFDV